MLYRKIFFALALGSWIGFAACTNTRDNDAEGNEAVDNETANIDPENQDANYRFESWDSDEDEVISNNEFDNAFTTSPYFDNWNKDNNEYISEEEFYQNYASVIDENKDGNINQNEWDVAINSYFTAYDYKPEKQYQEWDSDGNGHLSEKEVLSSLKEANFFKEWDKDGDDQLTEKELARGIFSSWDTDGDGLVQAEEYTDWYDSGF